MKKKNLKKAFNKRINFALFLGIAVSFSPLIVMGSCNSKSSQPRNNKDGDGNQNGGNGDSPDIPSKSKFEKLSDKVSLVTKVSKRESAFKDYEFKNTEMTLSDFASIFNLDISAAELTKYKDIKLIINKDKGTSKVMVKLKDTDEEKTININIDSFITAKEYFDTIKEQLQRYNFSLRAKDVFLPKTYSYTKKDLEQFFYYSAIPLPEDLLDKDVKMKMIKNKDDANIKYILSAPETPGWTYTVNVKIKKFVKNFKHIDWSNKDDKHPELFAHQERYYINYDDEEKSYLLDRQYIAGRGGRKFLMRNSLGFNLTNNRFILKNPNKSWQYNGFTENYRTRTDSDIILDNSWLFDKNDQHSNYGKKYYENKQIVSVPFHLAQREFSSILTSEKTFALSNLGWYSSIFVLSQLDPASNSVLNTIVKGAWDIFLMPGYKHNSLTYDKKQFPIKDNPEEQDMYLTTARGKDIDANELIFVSNSGMVSVTRYNLFVSPNITIPNLLSNSEKARYYEVQRKNFNSVYENKYDREADYYSIDFISSTLKSLGDKGYTFMYWKNHNTLSDETNYAGFKDIYPDKKELYQVTLDKNLKIKENKKIDIPAITLTYEDYKRKERALSANEFVDESTEFNVANEKINFGCFDITSKLDDDVSSISASDVTNYFKTSEVEIDGKKYFYLADEMMTKILVLNNEYQVEKTIDIPMSAFKKLEEVGGNKRYITKMFKKGNNLLLFSNYLETLEIDPEGNIVKEPKTNYSFYLKLLRTNTTFQNPYKNTEIFQINENKYLVFMHKGYNIPFTYDRISKITAIVDADGQFEIEE